MTDGSFSKFGEIWVYFDSGIRWGPSGRPESVRMGYALFPPQPSYDAMPFNAGYSHWRRGEPIGFWGGSGKSLWERSPERVLASPAASGSEVYDLVAALGAVETLRVNSYTGSVRMRGDSRQVIELMNGLDSAFSLEIEGVDVAKLLRADIRSKADGFSRLDWDWIPREENLVDRLMKSQLRRLLE